MATHQGSLPTGISATLMFSSFNTLNTETESLSGLTLQTKSSSWVMAIGLDRVAWAFCFFAAADADPPAHSAALSRNGQASIAAARTRTSSRRFVMDPPCPSSALARLARVNDVGARTEALQRLRGGKDSTHLTSTA